MSIDFEIPAEAKAIREKVRKWVQDECIPAEKELDTKPLAEVLAPLRLYTISHYSKVEVGSRRATFSRPQKLP